MFANPKTASQKGLRIISRMHDIVRDPEIQRIPKKEIELTSSYEGLREELREFLLLGGSGPAHRFEVLEHAGFPPFWVGTKLMVHTPKGALRVN